MIDSLDDAKLPQTPEELAAWREAIKLGYKVRGGPKRRKALFEGMKKSGAESKLFTAATTSTTDTTSTTSTTSTVEASVKGPARPSNAPPVRDIAAVNFGKGITLKRALKGGASKKTCIMEIGGTTCIVKGGSEDSRGHVAASEFLGKLNLKGVKVPAVRVLTGEEKQAVTDALTAGGAHADHLAEAVQAKGKNGESDGQVSAQAAGMALDGIFPNAAVLEAESSARAQRVNVAGMAQDLAWKTAMGAMIAVYRKKGNKPIVAKLEQWEHAKDAATRRIALDYCINDAVSPAGEQLTALLEEIDRNEVQDAIDRDIAKTEKRTTNQAGLKAFYKSEAGVEAMAGVAIGDLITGMHDRIVGDWNGGNVMFDDADQTLVCVDNSKAAYCALSTDPTNDEWVETFAKKNLHQFESMEDMIFNRIYVPRDTDTALDLPGKHVQFSDDERAAAKAKIRETMMGVLDQVRDTPTYGKAACDRAAYLRARLELEAFFKVAPELATPPETPEIGAGEKIERNTLSWGSKTKKRTQQIKDQLRDGTMTADQAKVLLKSLVDQKPELTTDRRSTKINFLISATLFRKDLEQKAGSLAALLRITPPGVWSPESARQLCQPIRAVYAGWKAALAKDAKTTKMLEDVWKTFPAEVRVA